MRQFLTVLWFEYLNCIKNKSFIITTLIMFISIAVVTNISIITSMFSGISNDKSNNVAAIVDKNEYISSIELEKFFGDLEWVHRNDLANKENIQEYIENETYSIIIYVDAEEIYLYQKGDSLLSMYEANLREMINQNRQRRAMEEKGFTQQEIASLQENIPINIVNISKDSSMYYPYVYILILMLYVSIGTQGAAMLMSVASEKSTKTMEVLITSAKIKNLMFGKVVGVGLAGLTQLIFLTCSGIVFIAINTLIQKNIADEVENILQFNIDYILILYTFIFFLLGYFLYAFIYAGVASTLSKIEDAGYVTGLPTMLLMSALLIAMIGMTTPNALYVKICSFIPFFAPMVMFMRIGLTDVSLIQIVVSIIICIISIVGVGILSAKVYRLGVMMYGKPPKLKTIVSLFIKA